MQVAIHPYMPTYHDVSDHTSDLNDCHHTVARGAFDIGACTPYWKMTPRMSAIM